MRGFESLLPSQYRNQFIYNFSNTNQANFIFEDCEECGKELNDVEKQHCKSMQLKTNQIHALCSNCLSKGDGEWPSPIINSL